jgi:hypothetical protein
MRIFTLSWLLACKNSYTCYKICHDGLIFCNSAKVYRSIPGSVELETANNLHEDVYMFMLASGAQVVKYVLAPKACRTDIVEHNKMRV